MNKALTATPVRRSQKSHFHRPRSAHTLDVGFDAINEFGNDSLFELSTQASKEKEPSGNDPNSLWRYQSRVHKEKYNMNEGQR